MSLVNQMLRDLDARRAGDAERGALPAAVTALDEPRGGSHRGAVIAAALMLVLGAAAAAYFLGLPGGTPPVTPPAPAAPITGTPAPASPPAVSPAAPDAAPVTVSPAPTSSGAPDPLPAVAVPGMPALAASTLKLDADLARLPAEPGPANVDKAVVAPSGTRLPRPKGAEPPARTQAAARPAPPPAAVPATATAAAAAPVPAEESRIDKQLRQPTPAERADAEFRRGQQAQRQGAVDDAMARYRAALAEQPEHAASRQALVLLLIERRRYDDAEEALGRGLALFPRQAWWPMTLARLKVERGEAVAALDILQRQAAAGEASSDYQGFHGALLQRAGRPGEAVERYAAATRLAPAEARWWAGLGIALESAGRVAEARQAFERARSLPGLPADLAAHVEQRLR